MGDFSKNGAASRAGGGRKTGGALMEGFVGQKSKGEGFFGVFGDAKFGGFHDF